MLICITQNFRLVTRLAISRPVSQVSTALKYYIGATTAEKLKGTKVRMGWMPIPFLSLLLFWHYLLYSYFNRFFHTLSVLNSLWGSVS